MPGRPKIFVDFSIRHPEGRFFTARLERFEPKPQPNEVFIATDYEDFNAIECRVLGIDSLEGVVYIRPVDPTAVPGTTADPQPANVEAREEFISSDQVLDDPLSVS